MNEYRHMWLARARTLAEAPARLRLWLTHQWAVADVQIVEVQYMYSQGIGYSVPGRFKRQFSPPILICHPDIVCGTKMFSWEDLTTYLLFRDLYLKAESDRPDALNLLGLWHMQRSQFQSWRTTTTSGSSLGISARTRENRLAALH